MAMLRQHLSKAGLETLAIDRIALFGQNDADSRFAIIGEWQLRSQIPTGTQARERSHLMTLTEAEKE